MLPARFGTVNALCLSLDFGRVNASFCTSQVEINAIAFAQSLGVINVIMEDYHWKDIVKSKSDEELELMIQDNNFLDIEARYYAFNELKTRNNNFKNKAKYQDNLYKDCIHSLSNISKTSLREYVILINPYIIIGLCIFSLINLLLHLDHLTFNNFWVISTLFFGSGGIITMILSKYQMRRINQRKTEYRKTIEAIIDNFKK